jgi:hypothetical protein
MITLAVEKTAPQNAERQPMVRSLLDNCAKMEYIIFSPYKSGNYALPFLHNHAFWL